MILANFTLQPWSTNRHFWGRRSALITLGLKKILSGTKNWIYMGSYKCIFLKTKGATRVAPNGPPIQTKMFMMCKFLHFYLLPLLNYCHFWGRRSGLITFGHTNNFVGHKKLNLHGVLKIYFIQNQRRYKICNKMATKCHKFPKSHTKNTRKMWFGHNLVVYGPIP